MLHQLDNFNPNWTYAQKHAQSCRPGHYIVKEGSSPDICQCCLNVIDKEPNPICANSKQLQNLGYGFPLYFIFTKYTLMLLLIQVLAYHMIGIYWAYQESDPLCSGEQHERFIFGTQTQVQCTSWFIRFARIQHHITDEEVILRIASFLLQLLGLLYMRDVMRKTSQYYHERNLSLANYSILIENIPKQSQLHHKITLFFKQALGKQYQIEEIVLLPFMDQIFKKRHKKFEIIQTKRQLLKKQDINITQLEIVQEEIKTIQVQINDEYYLQQQLYDKDQVQCEKAIVSFTTENDKMEIMKKIEDLGSNSLMADYFGEGSDQICIKNAPEPKEIIWQNINYSKSSRAGRVFCGWFLAIGLIGIVTTAFFFLMKLKTQSFEHQKQQLIKEGVSEHSDEFHSIEVNEEVALYAALIGIILLNKFILSKFFKSFTNLEKHQNGGEVQFSLGLKYTLGLFFTTSIMTILVEDIQFGNIYSEAHGVIEEESIMFFLNAYLVTFIWMVHPWYIYRYLRRKYYHGKKNLTQREANQIMEDNEYSMGKMYAELLESIWFVYLYASLMPLGGVIMLPGLSMIYWVDKYNLLRKSSVKSNISAELSPRVMKMLDLTLIFKPLGELFFDLQLRSSYSVATVVMLCVGFVYLFIPWDNVLECIHSQNFKFSDKNYAQAKKIILQNYKSLHPLFILKRQQMIAEQFDNFKMSNKLCTYTNLAREIKEGKNNIKKYEKNKFKKNIAGVNSPLRQQKKSVLFKDQLYEGEIYLKNLNSIQNLREQ